MRSQENGFLNQLNKTRVISLFNLDHDIYKAL